VELRVLEAEHDELDRADGHGILLRLRTTPGSRDAPMDASREGDEMTTWGC